MILLAPQTWPFGAALAILVGLAVIEGAGLLFGSSTSHWLDNVLPDLPDSIEGPLGWLHLGRVPLLVLFILFLAGFAVAGYVIQATVHGISGLLLPAWLASIPALLAGVSTLSGVGALIAKVAPGDETTAVSEQSLIGRAAVVTSGTARHGLAAEAKVRDSHGRMHYVMVEPDIGGQTFEPGASVLLVRKVGARFHCIANPHPELL
jgi:membrane protein implicated in regulation of membrane protease activity